MNIKALDLQKKVNQLIGSGHPDEAIELLEKTVKKEPDFIEAWMLIGSIYRAIGRIDTAIDMCKECIKKNPKNSIVWTNLGHLYWETNQFDLSIETNKKAISLDKKNPSPWYSLGMACFCKEATIELKLMKDIYGKK